MADNTNQDWPRYVSVGVDFAAAFGAPLVGGLLLDRWLETTPVLTLIGALVGFMAAIYQMVRLNQRLTAARRAKKERKPDGSDGDDAQG